MLHLIYGRQASGKTKYCTDVAARLATEGESVILLVPEQFNFECQKLLLSELGPVVSNKIEILSFTSLCKAICSEIGGLSGKQIDDGVRFMLVGKALFNVKDNLVHYGRYVNSPDFQKKMTSVISELKQAAITSDELKDLADKVDSSIFSDKLCDISLIFAAYNALMSKRFVEPLDIIEKTVNRMYDNSFFAEKTVFIDEFKGFTAAQMKLLERIVAGSKDVYATFCCDSETTRFETDIFRNVIESANDLKRIALSHGVECAEPVFLDYSGYNSPALKELESFFAQKTFSEFDDATEDITVCRARTLYDEVDFCMNTIRRMVRDDGCRYNDFVIISRRDNVYSSLIDDVSRKYEIPCFADLRVSLSELPLAVFVTSAVKAAVSFDTADILRYLKTGFAGLDYSEVYCLENYAYIWNISGKKWLNSWTLCPDGLKDNGKNDSYENTELNASREKAILPIVKLRKNLSGNVTDMCSALITLFKDCDTIELLKKYTDTLDKNGELMCAEYQRTGFDAFIKVLDKLCAVFGEDTITIDEFASMLSTSLGFETVGEIPRTKDQVIFGTADRIRPMRPKYVFLLGANHDVFPESLGDSGVFSHNEREIMIENELHISDFGIRDAIDEKYLFYYALTSASDKVFISYSCLSADNGELLPSDEVASILKAFPDAKRVERGFERSFSLEGVEAKQPAFEKMALNIDSNEPLVKLLYDYLKNDESYSKKIAAVTYAAENKNFNMSSAAAKKLYGDSLNLSPSKIEDFNQCHFKYFCKYGLKAGTVDRVDFNAATRGNIVHFCLETFINRHKEDIGTLNESDVYNEAASICDEYLLKSGAAIEDVGEKFDYMLSVLKETASIIAVALNNEFAQSEFKPKACEMKIGRFGEVPSVTAVAPNGVTVSLEGTVDRVDTTADGKVRVIDYKTGIKDFKLSQILNGMNMQMLLYLYSLVSNAKELLNADIPAGILYFPARRNMSEENANKFIKMNGLIANDIDTVRQMEAEGKGKLVPATIRPTGTSFYSEEYLATQKEFGLIFKFLDKTLGEIGAMITSGDIEAIPYKTASKRLSCEYCDYRSVCRINDDSLFREEIKLKKADVVEKIIDSIITEEQDSGC